jgi:hypothetical protein
LNQIVSVGKAALPDSVPYFITLEWPTCMLWPRW